MLELTQPGTLTGDKGLGTDMVPFLQFVVPWKFWSCVLSQGKPAVRTVTQLHWWLLLCHIQGIWANIR